MLIIFYLLLMLKLGRCTDDQIFETTTVTVGQNAALKCPCKSFGGLLWIKLVSVNLSEVMGKSFSREIVDPRIRTTEESGGFFLRIKRTTLSDAGVYLCLRKQPTLTFLKVAELRVEEPRPVTTAVPPPDPVRPTDSVTLQCSVLSDSHNKTCPGDHDVCCLTAGTNGSYPSFNHSQGNRAEEHEKKCVYSFFKNISSSDADTFYCAVATCGEMFCGNGTKPHTEVVNMKNSQTDKTVFSLLWAALALSLVVIAFLIYLIKKLKNKSCGCCNAVVSLQAAAAATSVDHQSQQTDEDALIYSVPTFTTRKSGKSERRDAKKEEEESIYTDVRALGLD